MLMHWGRQNSASKNEECIAQSASEDDKTHLKPNIKSSGTQPGRFGVWGFLLIVFMNISFFLVLFVDKQIISKIVRDG